MSLVRFEQASFGSGVLSPRLMGRVDFGRYYSGAQELENFLITPHGTMAKRGGWRYIESTKSTEDGDNPLEPAILVPFIFNNDESYILEVGLSKIRFFLPDGTRLEDGGVPVEVDSPYTSGVLPNIRYTQSADVLYLFAGTQTTKTKQITRTSVTSFTISDWFPTDGPFLDENTDDSHTLTPSGTSGSITIASSTALFAATDVDRLVRIFGGTEWGWAQITAFNSDTSVDATVIEDFENPNASSQWALGAWSDTTGYPSVGTFHDNRLFAASTPTQLFTLWGSRSSSFDSFQPTAVDDTTTSSHGIVVNFVAGRVHEIQWLESMDQGLVVGTSDGEGLLRPAADTQALGPDNLQAIFPSNRGSEPGTNSIRIDKSVLFIQRGGLTVRELFVEGFDDFSTTDLGELAGNLFYDTGAEQIVYQQSPDTVAWVRLGSGDLLSFTFERSQEVFAWAKHTTSPGSFESLAVIPGNDGEDQLWAVVNRTINGSVARYIERLDPLFRSPTAIADSFLVDGGITFTSGAATSIITGLDHLEGEVIHVFASGGSIGTGRIFGDASGLTVSSGQVDLETVEAGLTCTKAQAGKSVTAAYKSVPLEIPQATSRARKRKPTHIHLHFLDTRLGGDTTIAQEAYTAETIRDPQLDPFEIKDGLVTVPMRSAWERQTVLDLSVGDPTPFHLLGFVVDANVGGS